MAALTVVLAFPITDTHVLALVCAKHTRVQSCPPEVDNRQYQRIRNVPDTSFPVKKTSPSRSFSMRARHKKPALCLLPLASWKHHSYTNDVTNLKLQLLFQLS